MSDERPVLLQQLLETLLREEALLARLTTLSQGQRKALISSQFADVESVNDEMVATANDLVPMEEVRATLIESLGVTTLSEATAMAEELGVPGFASAHGRLREAAAEFRAGQERNASLVLSAIRLRERWMTFLGGRMAPTYGAGGKREIAQQRQIVSRSV